MESFIIVRKTGDEEHQVLIIPDECADKSVFHLVKDGLEYGKIQYSEPEDWQMLEDTQLDAEEFEEIISKIEEHYF